ncbi:hypothetical protein LP418_12170 [Nocardioides sp. B-3]|nr:hypothetical protein LP418_12170 [Nocardioides sp. B-3]
MQPPQGDDTDECGDRAGQQVEWPGGRADQRQHAGRAGESDDHQQADRDPAGRDDAGDAGEHEHAEHHRTDQDRLVGGAEVLDRPLLDGSGGQVDHRRADREDGRGRRNGQGRHEVSGRDTGEGGEDAEQGVEQSCQHAEGSSQGRARIGAGWRHGACPLLSR